MEHYSSACQIEFMVAVKNHAPSHLHRRHPFQTPSSFWSLCLLAPQRAKGASSDRLTSKRVKFRFQGLFLAWAPFKKYLIMLLNVYILKKPPHVL